MYLQISNQYLQSVIQCKFEVAFSHHVSSQFQFQLKLALPSLHLVRSLLLYRFVVDIEFSPNFPRIPSRAHRPLSYSLHNLDVDHVAAIRREAVFFGDDFRHNFVIKKLTKSSMHRI